MSASAPPPPATPEPQAPEPVAPSPKKRAPRKKKAYMYYPRPTLCVVIDLLVKKKPWFMGRDGRWRAREMGAGGREMGAGGRTEAGGERAAAGGCSHLWGEREQHEQNTHTPRVVLVIQEQHERETHTSGVFVVFVVRHMVDGVRPHMQLLQLQRARLQAQFFRLSCQLVSFLLG